MNISPITSTTQSNNSPSFGALRFKPNKGVDKATFNRVKAMIKEQIERPTTTAEGWMQWAKDPFSESIDFKILIGKEKAKISAVYNEEKDLLNLLDERHPQEEVPIYTAVHKHLVDTFNKAKVEFRHIGDTKREISGSRLFQDAMTQADEAMAASQEQFRAANPDLGHIKPLQFLRRELKRLQVYFAN